jgi:hypothetical protein
MDTVVKAKKADLYGLNTEINGVEHPQAGVIKEGLIHEELSFTVKYYLGKLGKVAKTHYDRIEKIRLEFIEKHGVAQKDGSKLIPETIKTKSAKSEKEIPNPKHKEFVEQMQELMDQDVEIKLYNLSPNSFSEIKSKNTYPILRYLFELSEEEEEELEEKPEEKPEEEAA